MKSLNCIVLLFLVILIGSCSPSSRHSAKFPSEAIVKIRMDSIMHQSDIPCLVAVAINKNGERLTYRYGAAIWNKDVPVTTSHIFRIASMTKLITSVAALQLVEKNVVTLDQDLSPIMPEMASIPILADDGQLARGTKPITLRQLLTHTSGFGYYFTDSLLAKFDKTNWKYDDLPRRFEGGTRFLYGTSTDWAGKLVEKLSGLKLEDYFRKYVTGPLKMDHSWYNVPDSLQYKIVSYGSRGNEGNGELAEKPDRIPASKALKHKGGGPSFSSPDDYTRLLACLLNDGICPSGRLLQKETIDNLFTEQLKGISMDIQENYFLKGFCCDFRGLIKPTSNWGLAGMIDNETTTYGRKKGTLLWGGVYNTYWYIDRQSGIAASIYTQYLPFNYTATTSVFDKFSEMIYTNYR